VNIHFASTTFCWLPPESFETPTSTRRLDAQLLAVVVGDVVLGVGVDDAVARDLLELRGDDRALDRVEQVEPEHLAVLAHVGDAVVDRGLDVLERRLPCRR
jgi:hypothetical protein